MSTLLQNAVWIPEANRFLVSTSRDHHVHHTFEDGTPFYIMGGLEFTHRGAPTPETLLRLYDTGAYVEYALLDGQPFEEIAEKLVLSDGEGGGRLIRDMDCNELRAVFEDDSLPDVPRRVAQHWLDLSAP